MVLKLYGTPLSTCVKRVRLALEEKGIEYEIVPVDLSKGEHKTESYLEKQPFGKIPVLEDDGFFIFGSPIAQLLHCGLMLITCRKQSHCPVHRQQVPWPGHRSGPFGVAAEGIRPVPAGNVYYYQSITHVLICSPFVGRLHRTILLRPSRFGHRL